MTGERVCRQDDGGGVRRQDDGGGVRPQYDGEIVIPNTPMSFQPPPVVIPTPTCHSERSEESKISL